MTTWLEIAPLLTLIGVFVTALVTISNARDISKYSRDTSFIVELFKSKTQFRMACIDRRLQVHQEAFTLWRKLFKNIHTSEIGATVIECQKWWDENCLYLEPEVRKAFADAFSCAHSHASYLTPPADLQLAKDNWKVITAFPNILFEAVQLPKLTAIEEKASLEENNLSSRNTRI
ncbi:hypothetical protein A1353_24045 [Methylomonas methanica]|uniref:DUF4760 domain-containing protein n=1 Tax=Methylomonas methanica TaxID=421 RepID=A0A177LVE5_METMH|nr:hypothetical protein [Methylomonas methanica]OAH96508.1 hypothetical protein A1353_24045 [Methylomonas methanica]